MRCNSIEGWVLIAGEALICCSATAVKGGERSHDGGRPFVYVTVEGQ